MPPKTVEGVFFLYQLWLHSIPLSDQFLIAIYPRTNISANLVMPFVLHTWIQKKKRFPERVLKLTICNILCYQKIKLQDL